MATRIEMNTWLQDGFGVAQGLLAKAAGGVTAPAAGSLPQPMSPDCKPVHGKVTGPDNHMLCGTHGHVLDTKSRMIIAHSLDEYKKLGLATHTAPSSKPAAAGSSRPTPAGAGSGKPAPVSMRLDEGPAPKAKNMEPAVMGEDSPDEDSARAAIAAKEQLKQNVISTIGILNANIKGNCAIFGNSVATACADFQNYAGKKLDEYKKKKAEEESEAASTLFGALTGIVLDVVGAGLVEKVVTEFGKHVADALKGAVKDLIVDQVKKAAKGGGDDGLDELKIAIGDLAQVARDSVTGITQRALDTFSPRFKQIQDGVESNKLSPGDGKFIYPFIDKPADADTLLEGYGVPNANTCKAIHVKIYRGLVEEFSKKLIVIEWKEKYRSDVIEDQMKNHKEDFDKSLSEAARKRANEEAGTLEKSLPTGA
jgi:hypothetical protein